MHGADGDSATQTRTDDGRTLKDCPLAKDLPYPDMLRLIECRTGLCGSRPAVFFSCWLIVQSRMQREADLPKCHQQDRSVKEVRPIVELRKCGNVPSGWRPAAAETGGLS